MDDLLKLYRAVVSGDINGAGAFTRRALDNGIAAGPILDRSLVPAMTEVGGRFEKGEYYIPDMLVSSQAMKAAMEILGPAMVNSEVEPVGSVAIGTIKGDLHDIGKNLVASLLEGNGFRVLDLGMDVGPERFVSAVIEEQVDIVAVSALLSTSMLNMKEVVEALDREKVRDRVKIIIGGAPITRAYADKIGADGTSDNANGAVLLAKQLAAAGKKGE